MAVEAPVSSLLRFGPFEADLGTGELRKHGLRIKLQDQPFKILAMLLEHPGELVTRDDIQRTLWPADTFVDFEHSVNAAIRRLREALNDDADTPRFIETLPRRGYRFLAEVTAIESPDARAVAPVPEPATEAPDTSRMPRAARVVLWRWPITFFLIAVIVLFFSWPPPLNPGIDSIAVLPFTNETTDPELDYLAVGVPARIIERLSAISSLRVASLHSTMTFRTAPANTHDAAVALNVRALLLGTIRRNAGVLQIRAELVDSRDNKHLWGAEYTATAAQVPILDKTIAAAVSNALHKPLPSVTRASADARATDPFAYDAYLRAEYLMERRTNQNLKMALAYLQKAVDLDPNFAPAYAAMSKAYGILAYYGGMPSVEALTLQETTANRAIELDPNNALAHLNKGISLANLHRNLLAGEPEIRRALELSPNDPVMVRGHATSLEHAGRFDEAADAAKRAEELDPLWPGYALIRAGVYYHARRYDDAIRLRDERPSLKANKLFFALVFALAGKRNEALSELADVTFDERLSPQAFCDGARDYGVLGMTERGRKLLREGLRLQQKLGAASAAACTPYDAASAYAALGDRMNALAFLDQAERTFDTKMQWLPHDPVFDAFRSDPAFQDIVSRMNTPR